MRRDLMVVPEGTTEDKLIELWLRLKKSEHTQRAYRRDIEVFRAFVEKPLVQVTLEDALDFYDNLDEIEIINKRGVAKLLEDNSKRRILNAVKSFYSFAYTSGIFPANVMAAVKPPSAKSAISQCRGGVPCAGRRSFAKKARRLTVASASHAQPSSRRVSGFLAPAARWISKDWAKSSSISSSNAAW